MPTRPWEEALDAAQRAFCLPLAVRVLAAAGTGNAAVSPIGVHAALSLAASGARGATRRQLLGTLGCGGGGKGAAADAANVASRVVKRVLKDRANQKMLLSKLTHGSTSPRDKPLPHSFQMD
ncbi:hypothetical protein VPH35_072215 [Triticum aestivum]